MYVDFDFECHGRESTMAKERSYTRTHIKYSHSDDRYAKSNRRRNKSEIKCNIENKMEDIEKG